MRTAFIALVLSVCLLVSAPQARTAGLDSIRPVQRVVVSQETGEKTTLTICTAWASTYLERSVWVMAAHCTYGLEGNFKPDGLLVDGKGVSPWVVSFTEDIAIYMGGPRGVAPFVLAMAPAAPLQPLWSAGYPRDSQVRRAVVGVMSAEMIPEDDLSGYDMAVAPGASGSPVIDTKSGLVVGMLTRSECPDVAGWCPASRGVRLERLRATLIPER